MWGGGILSPFAGVSFLCQFIDDQPRDSIRFQA